MTSTEAVTLVVRAGRAERYVEWRAAPGLLPSWHREAGRGRRLAHT